MLIYYLLYQLIILLAIGWMFSIISYLFLSSIIFSLILAGTSS